MPRRQFVPDEKRSLRGIFFISSMVLVGTTVWALWDESVSRRPWIRYQTAFKQLEYQTVQRELEEARARLDQPEVQTRLEKLREELRWAEEARRGPDYQAAVKEVEGRKAAYDAINQELRFTRSELDEAYYWSDKAKHEGRDYTAELAEVNRLKELERKLEPEAEDAKQQLEAAKERVKKLDRAVQEVRDKIKGFTAEALRLEQRLEAIRTRPLEVKQVVLDGLDKNEFDVFVLRVDRCETCHLGIDRPGFENAPPPFRTHPNREAILGKHPVSRFGCTVCHEGQGTALDFEWRVEGRIPDTPHGLGREYGGSPNILWDFPLLRGEMVESSCRKCHLDRTEFAAAIKIGEGQGAKVEWIDLAPTLTKGLGMFEILGCYGCHPVEGYKEAAKVGPELTRIVNKVEPGWLIQWIQNPQSYLPHTRMPNFGLSKEQATAIAAYLLARSEPDPPVAGRYNPGASPERGKQIFERVGCLGCHAMRAVYEEKEPRSLFKMVGRDHAPDLSNVATKIKDPQWLFRWLKNPKAIRPQTPMPNLRLTDEEASALTAFLMMRGERQARPQTLVEELKRKERIEEGRGLIGLRGCFGCHEIRGFETAQRIAPDLSDFGHKRLLQLSFGDAVQVHHTWEDWTFWKLKNPQIYATDREQLRMPNFGFSDDEVKTLRVLAKSFAATEVSRRYREETTAERIAVGKGQRLVRSYNCVGCHVIEGKGGDIRVRYDGRLNEAPPPLVLIEGTLSEGEKVQARWLFEFLHRPTPIRPWLQIRMPTFGLSDREVAGLASYFVARAGRKVPFEFVPPVDELRREMVEAGRRLASKEYFSCGSCHVEGDKKPEGPPEGWAPDFSLARRRLRSEWVVTWLKDPQKVQPGTQMPSFFLDETSGPDEILGGDEQKQILALREYLLSLGRQ
ncbi:MAG: octaheme cytochrome c [candidate division NC10 bacterium CSP1-5]|nr:MAG: octaheme cytochrome c [candidate division NC10 bacterium CSP1-5]